MKSLTTLGLASWLALALALTTSSYASAQSTGIAQPAAMQATAIQPVQHCCDEPTCGCEPSCSCKATGCCSSCGNNDCCGDCCKEVCVASVEKEKVEKHCWKIECEKVCIPKVVCPWDKGGSGLTCFNWLKKSGCSSNCGDGCCSDACCADACGHGGCDCPSCGCNNGCGCCPKPRCGKVISVRDLKKEKYECDKCVCKWEIRRLPACCGDGCCDAGCCGPECGTCCEPSCGANAIQPNAEIQTVSATEEIETKPEVETANATAKPWYLRIIGR